MNQRRIFVTIGTFSPVSLIMHRDEILIPDEPENPKRAGEILVEAVAEVYSVNSENLYWAVFDSKTAVAPIVCSENIP